MNDIKIKKTRSAFKREVIRSEKQVKMNRYMQMGGNAYHTQSLELQMLGGCLCEGLQGQQAPVLRVKAPSDMYRVPGGTEGSLASTCRSVPKWPTK